jgi:PAS domain S-box-containing protein
MPLDCANVPKRWLKKNTALSPENINVLLPEEIQRMFHELQVHQIELEMQNVELRKAQADLDAARERYFDLYDMAPVGYCTITHKGLIHDANLTATTLLGAARGALVKQPITRFIYKEDQDIYYLFHKQLFEIDSPQKRDLRMLKNDGTTLWVQLSGATALDTDGTPVGRMVMSDITERKHSELALHKSENYSEHYRPWLQQAYIFATPRGNAGMPTHAGVKWQG